MIRRSAKNIINKALDLTVGRSALQKARNLTRELYQPSSSIPPEELDNFRQKTIQLCLARGYSQQYIEDWMVHIYRFYLSLKELDLLIPDGKELAVLEMGSESVFTDLLKDRFPGANFFNTHGDLRKKWDFPDEWADLIISMEVVEHLTDPELGEYLDGFYKSGLKSTLRETCRVLKKGGKCFLTTPNAASIYILEKILSGNSAWYYPLHVREYTLAEITAELIEAGFIIEKAAAVNCLTAGKAMDYWPIFRMLVEYGKQTDNRGDDIFITAQKP